MNIKITSDSTSDLNQELLEKYSVTLIPLIINMADKSYRDGVDIVPQDIFDHVGSGGALCSTAAVNVSDYSDFFAPLASKYDAVIHVNISAEFSSCYQNACIAAEDFENVYVVDSRNLSTGHGHVVIQAALMAQQGMNAADIVENLKELTGRVEASFIVNNLEYLRKGGRCSSVAALGANLLKLKPCIDVIDGKMTVSKKYRGSFEKCLQEYVTDRLKDRQDIDYERIFITCTPCPEGSVELVSRLVGEYSSFEEVLYTTAGCTVSTHCGPGTLGILFVRKK